MALSNRDRIGQLFELLAPELDDYIQQTVAPVLTGDAAWTALVALHDAQKHGGEPRDYSRADPQVQLRMLTERITGRLRDGWYPFDDTLGRSGQNFASELREVRNRWAHNDSFTDDDAYRALDTTERLLGLIGSPQAAERVRQIRLGLRRVSADKADRRTVLETVNAPGAAGLLPWREVLEPHEDVATGNFQAAEFAADLYKVATSEDAGRDYSDPVLFFSRTYLTAGLRDLIDRAVRRLSGDANASPVINLQTNFGGGKTHSMLALWHLASGLPASAYPQELQELLAGRDVATGGPVRRVALVGNHLSVQGDIKPDGTRVNTLWGELAWQLGGAEAFAQVAEADAAGTPPGQVLHRLLADHAPAVILIDEWVAYARTLVGRDDLPAGTFDDQFTFAQALTEAVKGTPGVLLAISIPASESGDDATRGAGSDEEVGGSNGQKALERLQNVVRRVADQWRPASAEEAYRIVRQRLFTTPSPAALAHIGQTARSFVELYHKHQGEFPREARSGSYEDRIINSYPIHPELFDRLYEDWSGLERFQRTRGVLRLMNSVIHALWVGQDSAPLIMPSSIPLSDEGVNAELTQYLQDSWKAVIDADVDGPNAEPLLIDREKPLFGKRSLTRRLARTVFFGGAPTIGSAHKGLETQRVFLGTAVPGDVPGNFHSALAQLSDRATYFYNAGGRYWYDLQANISRQARDRAERMHIEDVYRDIIDRLRHQGAERGAFAGVVICPDDAAEIPDLDECRLVILHPRYAHTRNDPDSPAMMFARQATDHRGTANRTHRNMLIYLAPDAARFEDLEQAVRTHLAWSSILEDEAALDLTSNQRQQADEKRQQATATADERLLGAYHWTLVPIGQPIELDVIKTEGNQPALAQRVSRQLGNKGLLAEQHPANLIRLQLDTKVQNLWQDGHVRVGDLWRIYSEYPYMPRLRDRRVFDDGLSGPQQILWQQEGFALADGYDETTARYRGLTLPDDRRPIVLTDGTLIVRPERAVAQRAAEAAEAQAAAPMAASPGTGEPDAPGGAATITGVAPGGTGIPGALGALPGYSTAPADAAPAAPSVTRFSGSRSLAADRYGSDFRKLVDEILAPLENVAGVQLNITIDIEAISPTGFDDALVRTISENATTLKFGHAEFE